MDGIDASTGKPISGIDHLRQSIRDILTTPIGTRLLRRNYGSRLMYLLDAPLTADLVTEIRLAVAESLAAFEPRLRLKRIQVEVSSTLENSSQGHVNLELEGIYLPENRLINLDNIRF